MENRPSGEASDESTSESGADVSKKRRAAANAAKLHLGVAEAPASAAGGELPRRERPALSLGWLSAETRPRPAETPPEQPVRLAGDETNRHADEPAAEQAAGPLTAERPLAAQADRLDEHMMRMRHAAEAAAARQHEDNEDDEEDDDESSDEERPAASAAASKEPGAEPAAAPRRGHSPLAEGVFEIPLAAPGTEQASQTPDMLPTTADDDAARFDQLMAELGADPALAAAFSEQIPDSALPDAEATPSAYPLAEHLEHDDDANSAPALPPMPPRAAVGGHPPAGGVPGHGAPGPALPAPLPPAGGGWPGGTGGGGFGLPPTGPPGGFPPHNTPHLPNWQPAPAAALAANHLPNLANLAYGPRMESEAAARSHTAAAFIIGYMLGHWGKGRLKKENRALDKQLNEQTARQDELAAQHRTLQAEHEQRGQDLARQQAALHAAEQRQAVLQQERDHLAKPRMMPEAAVAGAAGAAAHSAEHQPQPSIANPERTVRAAPPRQESAIPLSKQAETAPPPGQPVEGTPADVEAPAAVAGLAAEQVGQSAARRSEWHRILVDKEGKPLADSEQQYGEAYRRERQKEVLPAAHTAGPRHMTAVGLATAAAAAALPSGQTEPDLPAGPATATDPQHLLAAAGSNRAASQSSRAASVWPWVVAVIITAVVAVAASRLL